MAVCVVRAALIQLEIRHPIFASILVDAQKLEQR